MIVAMVELGIGVEGPPRTMTAGKGPDPSVGSYMAALNNVFFPFSSIAMLSFPSVMEALMTDGFGGKVPYSKCCIRNFSSARRQSQSDFVVTFWPE